MSDLTLHGFICGPRIYQYGGWTFEDSYACGPSPLTKRGEPLARIPARFWTMYDEFKALPQAEQDACRIGGGCVRIGTGGNGLCSTSTPGTLTT